MSGIFINYRGEDSDTASALIDRELTAKFGSERVFLDSRSIPAGTDFTEEVLSRLRKCGVLLVVMGRRWLTIADEAGGRRIDDPRDWVRREITAAFTYGLRVIPVLMDGVQFPVEAELPPEIAGLGRRQHVPLRRRYTAVDLAYLVEQIIEVDPELAMAVARHQSSAKPIPRQLPAAPKGVHRPSRGIGQAHCRFGRGDSENQYRRDLGYRWGRRYGQDLAGIALGTSAC